MRAPDPDTDAEALTRLTREAFDYLLVDTASSRRRLAKNEPATRSLTLMAVRDGEVVGYGTTGLELENASPGAARVNLLVAAAHRGTGVGAALFDRLAEHWREIGATTVTGRLTSAAAERFATRHGFERGRVERVSALDLAVLPDRDPVAPEGIRLAPLSALPDARALYEIDTAVTADIPADDPWETLSFPDWKRIHYDDPRLDRDSTVLAFDDEEPVAVAWLERLGDRVWSGLTGTRRDHRGLGLARLVKTVALRRARAAGAVTAYTNNDATNAAMLAVNTGMGYRLHTEQYSCVLRLT